MGKKHEANGTTETAKPVRSLEDVRKAIEALPAGTKEQPAWVELGEGNVSRAEFRKLWLAIRIPKKTAPDKGVTE